MTSPRLDGPMAQRAKDLIRPVLNWLAGMKIPYKVQIMQPCEPLPDRPILYAANHFCFADTPIMGRITRERSYILLGRQRLGLLDRLYFRLNGVIYVDRKDREDMAAAKQTMAAYLDQGRSVVVFPESTWNLTPNLPMLPMRWGIIDVARQTGTQIIPAVLDYDRTHKICRVRFGSPVVPTPEEDNAAAIGRLRDTLASMRWEFWAEPGVQSRADLEPEGEKRTLFYSLEEYPLIDWEYERSCIYVPPHIPKRFT